MIHSNNAARVRLWMALKRGENAASMSNLIDSRMVQYSDLQSTEFAAVNPLRKVPALIRADGAAVFEAGVILNYLEDKYAAEGASMKPSTPEGRQAMDLLIRVHDLYIASPNCTAPGFSHSQGAMYLSYGWHGAARGMDLRTRAAKIAEIWKQLSWLEAQISKDSQFLVGAQLTLADLTWFPTCVFMEFMLPRVFGWPQLFDALSTDPAPTPFPSLARWYTNSQKRSEAFRSTHGDIWNFWERMENEGQFAPIVEELTNNSDATLKFQFGVPSRVALNYQETPPKGKFTGRYINQTDKGDADDEVSPAVVTMRDARELHPPATLESMGFTLSNRPTQCADFRDSGEVVKVYYGEIMEMVKAASGAQRVFVFDHTVRESGNTNLNASEGGSAAPVPRVHCDYTKDGAPRRLAQLAKDGIYSRIRGRDLSEAEVAELAEGRFAFINVWRSIDEANPVMMKPLAVCDEDSVPENDRFLYQLRFPDRTGENYSLRASADDAHRWFYYSRMGFDECLIFKVYDKKEDGPRFVFHTAFEDPHEPPNAPPRKSIEVRCIAFYDPPPIN